MTSHAILHRKISRNIADYGVWVAAKKCVARVLGLVYEKRVYRLYKIDTSHDVPAATDTPNFEMRLLEPTDTKQIAQIEEIAEWLEGRIKERILANDMCLVALDGERVAAFNLIALEEVYIPLIERSRRLLPQEAWSEHIAVHKDYRRRGLATQLRRCILAILRERGVRRLYGGTLSHNIAALKLTRKVGFTEFADVVFTKCFGVRNWQYERPRP